MTEPPVSEPGPARAFAAAIAFLTRLPVPGAGSVDAALLARSAPWFPAVGAIVGALGAAVLLLGSNLWPAPVTAVLAVTATVIATGAFHEDALADSADGFGGGWTRERVLEIMKDSRIGAYGAVALVLSLAIRIGCLAALAPPSAARALIGAHVLARWSSLPLIRALPYARDTGTGRPFVAVTRAQLVGGTFLAAMLASVALEWRALPAALVASLVLVAASRYFHHRIGGITGDCLGAVNQLVEVATYLVILG